MNYVYRIFCFCSYDTPVGAFVSFFTILFYIII